MVAAGKKGEKNMAEQGKTERRKERQRKEAILVHEIAKKITSMPNITFQGAIEITEMVMATIERDMKQTRAHTTEEIRDKWGNLVELPQEHTQGIGN